MSELERVIRKSVIELLTYLNPVVYEGQLAAMAEVAMIKIRPVLLDRGVVSEHLNTLREQYGDVGDGCIGWPAGGCTIYG